MILFPIIFVLTTALCALCLSGFFLRMVKNREFSTGEIYLYSVGLAPGILTLSLYYLLLLFPRRAEWFYVGCILTGFILLGYLGRRGWTDWWFARRNSRKGKSTGGHSARSRSNRLLSFWIPVLLVAMVCVVVFGYVIQQPIKDHDVVQYAMLGRIIAEDRAIDFGGYRPHERTGFYSQVVHPPAFSLLHTWEKFSQKLLGGSGDLLFRSISPFYALLILAVIFYWVRRIKFVIALLGILVCMSGLAFYLSLTTYHIDSFRIFFSAVSWIFLARSIERPGKHYYAMLGISSGLAAFAHSIGVMVAGLNCLALFLFLPVPMTRRAVVSLAVSLTVLFFGGIHYILDIFWGTGWIL